MTTNTKDFSKLCSFVAYTKYVYFDDIEWSYSFCFSKNKPTLVRTSGHAGLLFAVRQPVHYYHCIGLVKECVNEDTLLLGYDEQCYSFRILLGFTLSASRLIPFSFFIPFSLSPGCILYLFLTYIPPAVGKGWFQ